MQIVINIPKQTYKFIMNRQYMPVDEDLIVEAVRNGTPLPKGHGRLIDEERISLSGIHFETERDHAMMIGRLNSAPTIIEANKAEK